MSFSSISVVGLGYIGLPTAAILASNKMKVIGIDTSQHVVDTINSGKIHIVEPELEVMVKKAVDDGYLIAATTPQPADAFVQVPACPSCLLRIKTQYLSPTFHILNLPLRQWLRY